MWTSIFIILKSEYTKKKIKMFISDSFENLKEMDPI